MPFVAPHCELRVSGEMRVRVSERCGDSVTGPWMVCMARPVRCAVRSIPTYFTLDVGVLMTGCVYIIDVLSIYSLLRAHRNTHGLMI